MADTTAQREAEQWIVSSLLPHKFPGQIFTRKACQLGWGGSHTFDAVSDDGLVVGMVSTSAARTASGKIATGKLHKVYSDALFLTNVRGARHLLMIFSELSMLEMLRNKQSIADFPPQITLLHAALPPEIAQRVENARQVAVREMTTGA